MILKIIRSGLHDAIPCALYATVVYSNSDKLEAEKCNKPVINVEIFFCRILFIKNLCCGGKHMKTNRNLLIVLAVLVLALSVLACGLAASATPTPTVPPATDTPLPSPTPTNTAKPTSTPKPSATPDVAATQALKDAMANVQKYNENGYLPTTDGKLYPLDNYRRDMAKIHYLDYDLTGFNEQIRNFAAWADVTWTSAGPVNYPEYSGCGFTYRYNDSTGDAYTAMLTNDSVLLTYCDSSIGRCGRIGTTRGKGRLNLGNPASAHFEFIVFDEHAYALVDGEFIGEYTLSQDRLTNPGYFLYSIISGTNKDYGTRCEITNANLWVVK
jgi:hypothetical protein